MAAAKPPARYRGFSGALQYGLLLLAVVAILGGLGCAAAFWLTDGDPRTIPMLVKPIAALGGGLCVAAFLARWIAGAETNSLMSMRFVRGDYASLGALAGIIGAGLIAGPPMGSTDDEPTLSIGMPIDIAGPTLDGQQFDIKEWRGSVVVVDFWATWCPPCVAELPNLKSVHERYSKDGVKFVSVSLDSERAKLTRFLQEQPMPWPQIYFDEEGKRGWDNPLAQKYNVHAIPLLAVIDREGKVAALRVRGAEVGQAVARALAGNSTPTEEARLLPRIINLFASIAFAPPWLLATCTIVGALAVLPIELMVRRAVGA